MSISEKQLKKIQAQDLSERTIRPRAIGSFFGAKESADSLKAYTKTSLDISGNKLGIVAARDLAKASQEQDLSEPSGLGLSLT